MSLIAGLVILAAINRRCFGVSVRFRVRLADAVESAINIPPEVHHWLMIYPVLFLAWTDCAISSKLSAKPMNGTPLVPDA